jgi:hypothetical protein
MPLLEVDLVRPDYVVQELLPPLVQIEAVHRHRRDEDEGEARRVARALDHRQGSLSTHFADETRRTVATVVLTLRARVQEDRRRVGRDVKAPAIEGPQGVLKGGRVYVAALGQKAADRVLERRVVEVGVVPPSLEGPVSRQCVRHKPPSRRTPMHAFSPS